MEFTAKLNLNLLNADEWNINRSNMKVLILAMAICLSVPAAALEPKVVNFRNDDGDGIVQIFNGLAKTVVFSLPGIAGPNVMLVNYTSSNKALHTGCFTHFLALGKQTTKCRISFDLEKSSFPVETFELENNQLVALFRDPHDAEKIYQNLGGPSYSTQEKVTVTDAFGVHEVPRLKVECLGFAEQDPAVSLYCVLTAFE